MTVTFPAELVPCDYIEALGNSISDAELRAQLPTGIKFTAIMDSRPISMVLDLNYRTWLSTGILALYETISGLEQVGKSHHTIPSRFGVRLAETLTSCTAGPAAHSGQDTILSTTG